MDHFSNTAMQVRREPPAHWRLVDEQAERPSVKARKASEAPARDFRIPGGCSHSATDRP